MKLSLKGNVVPEYRKSLLHRAIFFSHDCGLSSTLVQRPEYMAGHSMAESSSFGFEFQIAHNSLYVLQPQESDRAPPLAVNLMEKRAAAMANFINTIRRNKPPVVTAEGLMQASSADLSAGKEMLLYESEGEE